MSMSLDRQKAIFWGTFIKVAASMYAPGVTNPPPPKDFPEGWTVVKNINAEAVAGFFRQREFIGFIAQSTEEPNHFAVVMHGSAGIADFLDDFEFLLEDFTSVPDGGRTEYGFTRFYESLSFVDPHNGASHTLDEYLKSLNPHDSFTVAGHSLGGALATLHSVVLASRHFPVEAYLYASPMVGDNVFVNTYNRLVKASYRIVNKPDIVPQLPGRLLEYAHVNTLFEINSLDYPEIKRTISCFHALDTYVYTLGATNFDLGSCKVN